MGTVLRDTYRIEKHLSSGGFGKTYVASNTEFDERVAIKEFFMKGVNQREDDQTTVSVSNRDNTEQFEEQRNEEQKTHPCLVPYEELPEEEKEFDRNTSVGTLKLIMKLGFKISK